MTQYHCKHGGSVGVELLECRRLLSSYFVDASAGSDLNSGRSWRTPWQTLAVVNAHNFRRGDKVYLTGTFSGEALTLGPAATGVSISSYALNVRGSAAKLGVPNAVVLSNVPATGVDISASNISIQNLTITADPASHDNGSYNYGVYLENHGSTTLSRETINHVTVSGFSYAGLVMQGWNTSAADSAGFSNVLIENSSFHDNGVSGIFVGTGNSTGNEFAPDFPATLYVHSNLTIKNCQTFNNAGYNASLAASYDGVNINNGNSTSGGIFISSVRNALVENSLSYNNCFNAKGGVGIWAFDAAQLTFQNDESYDNKSATLQDGDGFDFDHGVTNSSMQRDYSHGNDGAGFLLTTFGGQSNDNDDTIKFCISDDDGQLNGAGGIVLFSVASAPVLGANIYNNTVLAGNVAGSAALSIAGDDASLDTANVLNNIFITSTSSPIVSDTSPAIGITFGGNDYWTLNSPTTVNIAWGDSNFTTLTDWTASSHAVGERNQDPQLIGQTVSDLPIAEVGNLMLTPKSVLKKGAISLAGHHIIGVGKVNFFGRAIGRQAVGAG